MPFNHLGHYICECGKEFTSSQSFNGHKSHCKVHLNNKGTYEEYLIRQSNAQELANKASAEKRKVRVEVTKAEKKANWEASVHYCEKCGKELPHNYEDIYGTGRFCSRKCANSRSHSDETKAKLSKALKGKKAWNGGLILVTHEKKYCKTCGKELSWKNKSGYCNKCIASAPDRYEIRSESSKRGAQKAKESGKAYTWQTRDIQSYPEKFWETVLVNNDIPFEGPNKPIKKADGKNNYFLDFYIEKGNYKIDLEIDGKQHTYSERVESDKVRDEYLISLGYEVYRIPWNEINSDSGKLKMQNKINDFISFYKHL